jgi:hypothetical protein
VKNETWRERKQEQDPKEREKRRRKRKMKRKNKAVVVAAAKMKGRNWLENNCLGERQTIEKRLALLSWNNTNSGEEGRRELLVWFLLRRNQRHSCERATQYEP